MKNQTYRMTMLFDFYGEVLTPRQKEFFDLYYNEDLSLAEIAENYGISRQGVRDVIVRAEAIMTDLEDKTGLMKRFMLMQQQAQAILDMRLKALQGLDREKLQKEYDELEERIAYFRRVLSDDALVRQIERSAEFRNEKVALLEARRHYCWYLKGVKYANYYKDQINHMETLEDLYRVTAGIKRDLSD